MKLLNIEKIGGNYLKKYHATYENKEGSKKVYEIISREDTLTPDTMGDKVSAVMIVPFVGNKVALCKEFRMAINKQVYNFPAGLIDPGETAMEAAIRELREETGLEVTEVRKVLKPSFTSVGISDEKITIVFVDAVGEIIGSDNANEEIETQLYSKDELRNIVENSNNMCSRTQLITLLLLL